MIDPKVFFEALQGHRVQFFTGVPDSLLKNFCAYVDEHAAEGTHVITANEGSAIALAAGYHLATGEVPLVYMQNSGLGNAVNPLVSLLDKEVYQIPALLVIGWRGEPQVKDEPQHKKMGSVTPALLDAIGVSYTVLSDTPQAATKDLRRAYERAKKENAPHALLVRKDLFGPYRTTKGASQSAYPLSREEALATVIKQIEKNAIVVSTTGKLSRELFELREKEKEARGKDFLTVGSMGHASQIAFGIALSKPKRPVYCFDGDGAALMHLGGIAVIGQHAPQNFRHILFNNGMHESVGGQKTAGFNADFCAIALACGYKEALRATNEKNIKAAFVGMKKKKGPAFLEIRIKGGARDNLGRPTRSPEENKRDFMAHIKRPKGN